MARAYSHSAYWYAKRHGWTHSEGRSNVERFLDGVARDLRMGGGRVNGCLSCDPAGFVLGLSACAAMDIGLAVRDAAVTLATPEGRDRVRRELLRDLRTVRRPLYYARETARRRALAAERRKLARRSTLAAEPTPEALLAAWERRKGSKEDMVRLGGMLQDLECHVDNSLRLDGDGNVVGRNGGIRGWIRENLPELSPKYKTLMRYKAMAVRLRQATGTFDPVPTDALLAPPPEGRHEAVRAILEDSRVTFASLEEALRQRLDPERVFLDPASPGARTGRKRRAAAKAKRRRGQKRQAGREGNENFMRKNFGRGKRDKNTSGLSKPPHRPTQPTLSRRSLAPCDEGQQDIHSSKASNVASKRVQTSSARKRTTR